jgi:YVTN family beta-propeller protein
VVGLALIALRTIDDPDVPADSIPAPTELVNTTTFEHNLVFQTMSGGSNLWTVGNGSTFLLRIDPATGAEAERFTLPAAADLSWMEAYKGRIYILSQAGVMVLDDETGVVTGPKVASDLGDAVTLAFTDDAAWVFRFDKGNGRLEKWDQQLESMELSVDLGVQNPAAMVGVGDSLYLATADEGLQHYGPDGTLLATIPDINFSQDMMVSSDGDLWVADLVSGEVVRVDTSTDRETARIRVGGSSAHSLWVTDESVWVTTSSEDTLSVIDPATNKVTATKLTLDDPRTLTLFDGRIWVAGMGWLQSFTGVSE